MRLQNRIAIVTGAAGGIGAGIVQAFVDQGATVIAADLKRADVEAVAERIGTERVTAAELDVTDAEAAAALVAETVKQHGRIDILANVAGVGSFGHFNDVTLDEFNRVMQINLMGSFICAQAAAREMVKAGYGRIINIASISGERAGESRTAYGTSKAAVIGMTRQAARDLARDGITVNAIGPGPVDTQLTRAVYSESTRGNYYRVIPAKRFGEVEEMADAAVFLAGEAAGYVNGHILFVDGGYVSGGVAESAEN